MSLPICNRCSGWLLPASDGVVALLRCRTCGRETPAEPGILADVHSCHAGCPCQSGGVPVPDFGPYHRVAEVAAEQGLDADGVARVVRSARACDALEAAIAADTASRAACIAAVDENDEAYDALSTAEEDVLDEAFAVRGFEAEQPRMCRECAGTGMHSRRNADCPACGGTGEAKA